MLSTKVRSSFGSPMKSVPGLAFQRTGSNWPCGNATTKPSRSAISLNSVMRVWTTAPSYSPWKLTTNGSGRVAVVRAGHRQQVPPLRAVHVDESLLLDHRHLDRWCHIPEKARDRALWLRRPRHGDRRVRHRRDDREKADGGEQMQHTMHPCS